ncbi:hypothetical protein WJX72_009786 [[Myrmecia] bisecta]|uniref:Uncharacterized protein n=1 Tax=[Myrmecia] bisecta TaxID=41462 RepID=A0AAW1PQM3_9CHLO
MVQAAGQSTLLENNQDGSPTANELQLQLSQNVDFSSMFGLDSSQLTGGMSARCVCFHPRQPTVALAAGGMVAEYDLHSGCKLGSTDAFGVPVSLAYTSDGSNLIALLKERGVVAWNTLLWKRKVLLPSTAKQADKPLSSAHMAVFPGSKPTILYCPHGATSVRMVEYAPPPPVKGAKDRQGAQLKSDGRKPIIALAAHPQDQQLLVLYADGTLSGCMVAQGKALVPQWTIQVEAEKVALTRGTLSAEVHPLLPTALLIVVGTSAGTVTVLEAAKQMEPKVITRHQTPGHAVIGVGINLTSSGVMSFGQDAQCDVRGFAWQLLAGGGGSTTSLLRLGLQPASVRDAADVSAAQQADDGNSWEGMWRSTSTWANALALSGASSHEIGRVHMHRSLGLLAVQWAPTSKWMGVGAVPISQLTASDAVSAKQLLSVTILRTVNAVHPGDSLGVASCCPLHTGLPFWAGEGASISKRLAFPKQLYLLDNGHLAAYSPASGKITEVAPLPTAVDSSGGATLAAHHVVHSALSAAWLVFFKVTGSGGKESKTEVGSWVYTLIPEANLGKEVAPWFHAGISGTFTGAKDEYVAVLSNDGLTIRLYVVRNLQLKSNPVSTLKITGGAGAVSIFPGPAWSSLPRDACEYVSGGGVVTWSDRSGLFAISDLPSSSGARASVAAKRTLQLLPTESVVQVAWQSLLDPNLTEAENGVGKASVVGAVVTTERLLVVSATLQVLVATPLQRAGQAITSALWCGPALLFTTAGHQVMQLAWDGSVTPVCSLGGGPAAVLAGALADRLLVLRGGPPLGANAGVEISARFVALLQPLLVGWATLASRGILPGGLWRARKEMGKLVCSYDSTAADASLLRTLADAGCADVAVALAENDSSAQLTPADQAAAKAAAGYWREAVAALMNEYKRSIYHPRPPPKGSLLHTRLVKLGRAAAAYGKLSVAKECWETAAQWTELLPLCALQADFEAVRRYGAQGPPEVRILADQLLAAVEPRYRRSSPLGAGAPAALGDWNVRTDRGSPAGALGEADEEALDLAPSGSVPMMEAGPTGEAATISQLDATLIEAYLGVGQSMVKGAILRRATDQEGDDEDGGFMVAAMPGQGGEDGDWEDGADEGGAQGGTGITPETAAQAAARAAFADEKAGDGFYSSDEEGDEASSNAGSQSHNGSFSTSASGPIGGAPKFKVVIRGKDELPSPSGLGPGAGNPDALKLASQNLRLSQPDASGGFSGLLPPPGPTGGFQMRSAPPGGSWGLPRPPPPGEDHTPGHSKDPSPSTSPLPSPNPSASPNLGPGRPMRASQGAPSMPLSAADFSTSTSDTSTAASGAAAQFSSGAGPAGAGKSGASATHAAGVALMESGQWDGAAASFSLALTAPGGKRSAEAQYLAAVRLLKAAATAAKPRAAKLTRYAAALELEGKHRKQLVQSAAARNMEVGNYGYAAEQLTWLVTQSAGIAPDEYMLQLQEKLAECDKKGGSNTSVAPDEDLETFSEIVGASASVGEVDACVGPLLSS